MKKFSLFIKLLCIGLLANACIKHPVTPRDPFESSNREVFKFNENLDQRILRPIAKTYRTVVPGPVRQASTNFYDNLALMPTVANDILQVQLNQTMKDSWRFVINSTVGIAGLFDVAQKIGLPEHYNDFGITLAKLGAKNSPYLVIPFIGPSTVRDGIGIAVDNTLFSIYPYLDNDALVYSLLGYRLLVYRAQLLDSEKMMEQAAIDRYTFIRDAYLQYRDHQINAGNNNSQTLYIAENQDEGNNTAAAAAPDSKK